MYRPISLYAVAPATCLPTVGFANRSSSYIIYLKAHGNEMQTLKAIMMLHQIIRSWYTGRWWVGCYTWYSEEGPGRAAATPSPLLAVPNVTAHPSTASVPITLLCLRRGLTRGAHKRAKLVYCSHLTGFYKKTIRLLLFVSYLYVRYASPLKVLNGFVWNFAQRRSLFWSLRLAFLWWSPQGSRQGSRKCGFIRSTISTPCLKKVCHLIFENNVGKCY